MNPLRRLLVNAPFAQAADLRGKIAIVTGTAPGSIGFETAKGLARQGAAVTITSRKAPEAAAQLLREGLAREGIQATIHVHALDLCDAASVAAFADWHRARHDGRLDLLVNNAGIHLDLLSQWKAPKLSADGHEIHWRTNTLGTLHLTHLLLPSLQAAAQRSGDARIVNVVSQLHAKGRNDSLLTPPARYNSWVAYGNSKLALVHATYELQRRFAQARGVQAYCLHPGAVYTNIADKGLAGNPMIERVRKIMAPVEAYFLLTPEEGAQTSLYCATEAGLKGGRYFQNCQPRDSSPDSLDAAVSAEIWDHVSAWIRSLQPA